MKLDPGIHTIMHLVFFGKTGQGQASYQEILMKPKLHPGA
jgi:hypothetical protein